MRILFFAFLICLTLTGSVLAENKKSEALHGQSWGFGQSRDRYDLIWKKGMDGAAINKKRTPSAEAAPGIGSIEKNDSARNSLGVTLHKESSAWSVAPNQDGRKIDEGHVRERRNIVRAFADIEAGEDFNINFGPELILKDDEHSAESANSDQPDSALGLGMKFKFDF